MGKRLLVITLVAGLLAGGALVAWAGNGGDVYVIVDGGAAELAAYTAASLLPVGTATLFLYTTQEDLLATLNSLAGTSFSNWYVWVCIDTACAPVDPYTVGN